MSEPTHPQPQPVDETNHRSLQRLAQDAVLRGHPSGAEQCSNCLYYIEPEKDVAYCWHPKIRVLVGDRWWCQWWEAIEDADQPG